MNIRRRSPPNSPTSRRCEPPCQPTCLCRSSTATRRPAARPTRSSATCSRRPRPALSRSPPPRSPRLCCPRWLDTARRPAPRRKSPRRRRFRGFPARCPLGQKSGSRSAGRRRSFRRRARGLPPRPCLRNSRTRRLSRPPSRPRPCIPSRSTRRCCGRTARPTAGRPRLWRWRSRPSPRRTRRRLPPRNRPPEGTGA